MSWEKSPLVLIQDNIDEKLLKYPAVTICPKVSTKYGIAERLGNYIDPNKLPEKALLLKKELFKCKINSPMTVIDNERVDGFLGPNSLSSTGCGKFQTLPPYITV